MALGLIKETPVLNVQSNQSTERLIGIDVLRGIAVIAVVLNHIPHYAMGGFRENCWFFPALLMDYGYLGVALFVVISGFCIHRRTAMQLKLTGNADLDWKAFWIKRVRRLYPPYLASIVLSLTIAATLHSRYQVNASYFLGDMSTHLAMVHNLTHDFSGGLGNAAFWSLGMEEQLYLLYFLLLMMMVKSSRITCLIVAAVVTVSWRAVSSAACRSEPIPLMPESIFGLGSWGLWPFSFWLHWTLGAIAVDAHLGNTKLPKFCSSSILMLLTCLLGMLANRLTFDFIAKTSLVAGTNIEYLRDYMPRISNLGELLFAISFFICINWILKPATSSLITNVIGRGFAICGKISYSVYLTHLPIVFALEEKLPFGNSPSDWLGRTLSYFAITIGFGAFFYWTVERWFLSSPSKPQLTHR